MKLKDIIDAIEANAHRDGEVIGLHTPVYLDKKQLVAAVKDIALRSILDQPTKADLQLLVILKYSLGI